MDAREARRERAVLLGILLLVVGLILGWWLGRVVMVDTDSAAAVAGPAPTVTVTPPDEGLSPLLLDRSSSSRDDLYGVGTTSNALVGPSGGSKGGEGGSDSGVSGTGGGSGSGSGSGTSGGASGGGSGTVDAGSLKDFTLRAFLAGDPLLLGQQRNLTVRITNPNPVAITLQTLRVSVGQPAASGCLPSWLDVADYNRGSGPAVVIGAGASREIPLAMVLVNLPTTNQDACQGTAFPLTLTGTARS